VPSANSRGNRQCLVGDKWEAFRAGTKPTRNVLPGAIEALCGIGIAHEDRSKAADEFRDVDFDLIATVCDSAAEECPVWPGKGKRAHRGFPNPARAQGMDQEVMNLFRAMRDDIEYENLGLLDTHS